MYFSGVVTSMEDGSPLEGAAVQFRIKSNFINEVCATALTDASGAYSVDCRFASSVLLLGAHVYFIDVSLSGFVAVSEQVGGYADPASVSDVDVQLARAGILDVHVLDSDTGEGIAGVEVHPGDGAFQYTDADGIARFEVLPGSYAPCVHSQPMPYVPECLGGSVRGFAPWQGGGDLVEVVAGQTSEVAIGLEIGGSIEGQVVAALDSAPFPDMRFTAVFHDTTGVELAYLPLDTDATGRFRIDGLPEASVKLSIRRSWDYPVHLDQAFPGVDCYGSCDMQGAATLELSEGSVLGDVDFALHPSSVVGGTVTHALTGDPIAGVSVHAKTHLLYASPTATSVTDELGRWEIVGLGSTDFFRFQTENDLGLVEQVWPDLACPGSCDVDGARIPLGENRSDMDFSLSPGMRINGTLVQRSALGGAMLRFDEEGTANFSLQWMPRGGEFRSAPLPPGTYTLTADPGLDSTLDCVAFDSVDCLGDIRTPIEVTDTDVSGITIRTDPDAIFVSRFGQ